MLCEKSSCITYPAMSMVDPLLAAHYRKMFEAIDRVMNQMHATQEQRVIVGAQYVAITARHAVTERIGMAQIVAAQAAMETTFLAGRLSEDETEDSRTRFRLVRAEMEGL